MIAFLLSLVQPGAGHFLLGGFRRGTIWAVGVAGITLALLFGLPVGLPALALALVAWAVGHVASAVDTVKLPVSHPRWRLIVLGWGALLVVGNLVTAPLKDVYRERRVQAFTIPAGSMRDTLLVGDYILVGKSVYRTKDPQRGDVVVFRYPMDERRDFIKRVIGVPGDTVQVRRRQVLINGQELEESYLRGDPGPPGRSASTSSCGYAYACEPLLVPAGSYFVLGDNRDSSQDSRHWGFVNRDKIKGKALVIYWSWDRDRHRPRGWRLGHRIS